MEGKPTRRYRRRSPDEAKYVIHLIHDDDHEEYVPVDGMVLAEEKLSNCIKLFGCDLVVAEIMRSNDRKVIKNVIDRR